MLVGRDTEPNTDKDARRMLPPRLDGRDASVDRGAAAPPSSKGTPVRADAGSADKFALMMKQEAPLSTREKIARTEQQNLHQTLASVSAMVQRETTKRTPTLSFLNPEWSATQRTAAINSALSGKMHDVDAGQTYDKLTHGQMPQHRAQVLNYFGTMPKIDLQKHTDLDTAAPVFGAYTREKYENVTGIANKFTKYDRTTKLNRPMQPHEIADGVASLNSLKQHWHSMPAFEGTTVHRVVHAGTGEDALHAGASLTKHNPTSTSVATDLSRLGPDKVAEKIRIVRDKDAILPVDTRPVSTYTHEGEILLPPGTRFSKIKDSENGAAAEFEAHLPTRFAPTISGPKPSRTP